MPSISLVMPAYNEAENIEPMVEEATPALEANADEYEIIVVDDGSSDGTAEWVRSQDEPRLRLVRRLNRGLAGARNGGIAAAEGESRRSYANAGDHAGL